MKTEYLILLGIGAYYLYSKSSGGMGPFTYPPPNQNSNQPGSRSTGSGGTTATGAGQGTSLTNPPVGGSPGNPGWPSTGITSNPAPGQPGFVGPVDGANYVQCMDGSYAADASQCPENMQYDTGDPCDPNSVAYDPNQCGQAIYTGAYDSGDPCDPNSAAYDPSQCGESVGYL